MAFRKPTDKVHRPEVCLGSLSHWVLELIVPWKPEFRAASLSDVASWGLSRLGLGIRFTKEGLGLRQRHKIILNLIINLSYFTPLKVVILNVWAAVVYPEIQGTPK